MFSNFDRVTYSRKVLMISQNEEFILDKKHNLNPNYHDIELIHHKRQDKHKACDNLKTTHPGIKREIVQFTHN